jgi:hypothetical protein
MPNVRLIKHEAVPKCGSFEVRFPGGAPSRYWYWDDLPSRRLRPDLLDSEQALEQAKAFARAERERRTAQVRKQPSCLLLSTVHAIFYEDTSVSGVATQPLVHEATVPRQLLTVI